MFFSRRVADLGALETAAGSTMPLSPAFKQEERGWQTPTQAQSCSSNRGKFSDAHVRLRRRSKRGKLTRYVCQRRGQRSRLRFGQAELLAGARRFREM